MSNHSSHSTVPLPAEGLKAATILNNDVSMPWLGLGVWQIESGREAEAVVRTAIDHGYRSIDTASFYGNERGVGQGIRASGVPREEVFLTTKVWNDDVRRDRIEDAFDRSLDALGFDYVDLYLIHWPIKGKVAASWKVLEKINRSGRAKAIGVSNHMIPHLDELLVSAEIVPAVNQIEFHPYLQSRPLVEYCRGKGIHVEAWSPLMHGGELFEDRTLREIAAKHEKTVAQVVLRWDLQNDILTIPKSVKKERIIENAAVFDFTLTMEEMTAINALDHSRRSGPDPFNFSF